MSFIHNIFTPKGMTYHDITSLVSIGGAESPVEKFPVVVNLNWPYNKAKRHEIIKLMEDDRITYHVGIIDHPDEKKFMKHVLNYFEQELKYYPNHRILFHCYAGISRSSTVAIMYLMTQMNKTLREIFLHTRQCRKQILPNTGFIEALCEHFNEETLFSYFTLERAVELGSPRLIEYLIQTRRADPNEICSKSMTMLELACDYGWEPVISVLLDNGADPNPKDSIIKPLHMYSYLAPINLEIIEKFIQSGSDINEQDDNGNTILHTVCFYRVSMDDPIVKGLIKLGANPRIKNFRGHTPKDVLLPNLPQK